MPRNMSFMLTEQQVRDRTKTVTRRNGWLFLKEGVIVNACKKCMGLKKGQKVQEIARINILSVRREPLNAITKEDCIAEGFPNLTPAEFVEFYCKHNKINPDDLVTRIEFEYLGKFVSKKDRLRYRLHSKVKKIDGVVSLRLKSKTGIIAISKPVDFSKESKDKPGTDENVLYQLSQDFGYSFQLIIT